jgi:hypothetical protein
LDALITQALKSSEARQNLWMPDGAGLSTVAVIDKCRIKHCLNSDPDLLVILYALPDDNPASAKTKICVSHLLFSGLSRDINQAFDDDFLPRNNSDIFKTLFINKTSIWCWCC